MTGLCFAILFFKAIYSELMSEPGSPGCAFDSTTVLNRKLPSYYSLTFLCELPLFPSLKERLPVLLQEYSPLDMQLLFIQRCYQEVCCLLQKNILKRNGRFMKLGLTHSCIPLILLLSRQKSVQ